MDGQDREREALQLLEDKLEYLQLKGDFFEDQTEVWAKLIHKQELRDKETSKEEQELMNQFNERKIEKKKLISHLKAIKNHVDVTSSDNFRKIKEKITVFTRIDGFFECIECHLKTKKRANLVSHINAVHRKLKPYKCSDCDRGWFYYFILFIIINCEFVLAFLLKSYLKDHKKIIHTTKKDWVCDCCGSRLALKRILKKHMMIHLPPSFACSKCNRKFVRRDNLTTHLKFHAGILNKACKICNKRYSTKGSLNNHIKLIHFSKLLCQIPNCSYKANSKQVYILHLKSKHKSVGQNTFDKLKEKLQKLKPDFHKMKYV